MGGGIKKVVKVEEGMQIHPDKKHETLKNTRTEHVVTCRVKSLISGSSFGLHLAKRHRKLCQKHISDLQLEYNVMMRRE